MTIKFNGKHEEVAEATTIAAFLEKKNIRSPHLILELNGEILADPQEWTKTVLNSGDALNAFSMVGGG